MRRNKKMNDCEDLNFAIKEIWQSLKNATEHYMLYDKHLCFDSSKEEDFHKAFIESYTTTMNAHMDASVSELDRHKVAAVIIEATAITNVISSSASDGRIFLGQEMIAAEVAFAWMIARFKRKLQEINLTFQEQSYYMPVAFACDTSYFDIFCRNVYFAKENGKLNVLDLAEKFFLLEYITLLKHDIDPELLHGR